MSYETHVFVFCLGPGLLGFISAQKGGDTLSTSSSTTLKSNSEDQTSKINKKPEGSAHLDNREIYNWNNGQQATPTGNEATGTNSGYSALRGESTKKIKRINLLSFELLNLRLFMKQC